MNLEIKPTYTVTFNVSECKGEVADGTYTMTFDLSKLTQDNIEQYLLQTLVIKAQGKMRAKTAKPEFVTTAWEVPEPGKRISTDPMKKANDILSKFSKEQIRAMLLAQLEEGEV
jgi:hypothetical protein